MLSTGTAPYVESGHVHSSPWRSSQTALMSGFRKSCHLIKLNCCSTTVYVAMSERGWTSKYRLEHSMHCIVMINTFVDRTAPSHLSNDIEEKMLPGVCVREEKRRHSRTREASKASERCHNRETSLKTRVDCHHIENLVFMG